MNILTIDIEDWYNCDFITPDLNWSKYEVRIYEGVDRILQELDTRQISATFFCLGWIADHHPDIIRRIHSQGHQLGCHSYQHELSFRFDRAGFKADTEKAKKLIEDLTGDGVFAYRAPAFSINRSNVWALEVLVELGFRYDSSIMPAAHDYGGFPDFGLSEPVMLHLPNGAQLKEFPISIKSILGKNIVFSSGGFFRFFPYPLIKSWAKQSQYMMTYFHPRDFDPGQPMIESLPMMRKFKSYVGLKASFAKFQKLLNDFDFISVKDADQLIDWNTVRKIEL